MLGARTARPPAEKPQSRDRRRVFCRTMRTSRPRSQQMKFSCEYIGLQLSCSAFQPAAIQLIQAAHAS